MPSKFPVGQSLLIVALLASICCGKEAGRDPSAANGPKKKQSVADEAGTVSEGSDRVGSKTEGGSSSASGGGEASASGGTAAEATASGSKLASVVDLVLTASDPRMKGKTGCHSKRFAMTFVAGSLAAKRQGASGPECAASQSDALVYGPSTDQVPKGVSSAAFLLLTSKDVPGPVAKIDVFCPQSGKSLASREVRGDQFVESYGPQVFTLTFDTTSETTCDLLEFRVFWIDGLVHWFRTTVSGSDTAVFKPGDAPAISYPGVTDGGQPALPTVKWHAVGCLVGNLGWTTADTLRFGTACGNLQPASGNATPRDVHMTYGPMTTAIGDGVRHAVFRVVDFGGAQARLEVASANGQAVLASRDIGPADFPEQKAAVDIDVPFFQDSSRFPQVEFRILWKGGTLEHQQTTISARDPADRSCTGDRDCRAAPKGCVFNYAATTAGYAVMPYICRRDHNIAAAEYEPFGGEGTPAPGTCVEPAPFCVQNKCQADPEAGVAGVLMDERMLLHRGNNDPRSIKVEFRDNATSSRPEVVLHARCSDPGLNMPCPSAAAEHQLASLRHTPYGNWCGSYELPQPLHLKVQFAPETKWIPKTQPPGSGEVPFALIVLQPLFEDGKYVNVWAYKETATQKFYTVTMDLCRFPGDACEHKSPDAHHWTVEASDMPTTVYMRFINGAVAMLDSNGDPILGRRKDQASGAAPVPVESAEFSSVGTLYSETDISVMNEENVVLEGVVLSRKFVP